MSQTYFDLPKNLSDYDTAKVAILPAPFEMTTSYVKGTSLGPKAILTASMQTELYDEELEVETCDIGISTLPAINFEGLSQEKALDEIEKATFRIVNDNKLPVILGGEHSITPRTVAAVAKRYPSLTVVQFDAHADLREEYEGTRMSHASAMARVLEICPAVQIGIRNLSKPEAERIKKEKLPVYFAHSIKQCKDWKKSAIDSIKTDFVYVTVDVDVFDSALMPDTGTPEPGGLDWYEVTQLIREISFQRKIVGFDFVELCPRKGNHASDFLVAKLMYRCIGYWAIKLKETTP